jgi:hypothetical protein
MAGRKRKATDTANDDCPAKRQNPDPIPSSSPLKPLPEPEIRDSVIICDSLGQSTSFEPVPMECFPRHISRDLPQESLLNIFKLFCPIHIVDKWAEYMNVRYIMLPGHVQGPRTKYCRQNDWKPTYASEIYLFFAILIYMTIHIEPSIEHYWSTSPTSPTHPITRFMSRNRFQLLYRRFCIWDTENPPIGVFNKINDFSAHLQETSTQYWKPAAEISIDEAMVRFSGKSADTVHLPSKPIPIGYKVWVAADSGYFLRWSFHAKGTGPIGYNGLLYPTLAPTQGIVADLLNRLPIPPTNYGYHCYMDNLFSTPELFELLRYQGIAATGTTRHGRIDSRKMAELKVQDRSKDTVPWGTLYARKHKEKEVMQFAFKDNALVLALSTHFSGWEPSIWRLRRQPGKTSTSARTARAPFKGQPLKMLQIPCLIDAYNHHMNGVDNGDQLRAEFEPSRRIKRGGQQALIYLFLLGK